jgi:2-dehydropantoate 2-reductase
MPNPERGHVCVLGAGGLGSLVGARLAQAGVRVTLVGRPAHVAAIRRDGLRVDGIRGTDLVTTDLEAVTGPADVRGPVDVLMLAVKARDTAAALEDALALRSVTRTALSLQNSVTKDGRLADWIGAPAVVGAATTESATLTAPGQVRHTGTAPVAFYFGELDGRPSARVDDLVAMFTAAGFGCTATSSIDAVEWEKLLQAALIGAYSVTTVGFLPDRTITDVLQTRPGAEYYVQLATELLAVYRALGFTPRDFFAPYAQFRALAADDFETSVERAMYLGRSMADAGVRGRPSMHDDLLRHKPTEADESIGEFVRAAARLGVAVPVLTAAHRIVASLELLTRAANVDVYT